MPGKETRPALKEWLMILLISLAGIALGALAGWLFQEPGLFIKL